MYLEVTVPYDRTVHTGTRKGFLMSNIKRVEIDAEVPYNYLGTDFLKEGEISFLASLLMHPSIGLKYRYEQMSGVDLPNGGYRAMYRLSIRGEEAIAFAALGRIVETFRRQGWVCTGRAMDIQFDNTRTWEAL